MYKPLGGLSDSKISPILSLFLLPPLLKYHQHFLFYKAEPGPSFIGGIKPLDQLVSKFPSSSNILNMWEDLPFGP